MTLLLARNLLRCFEGGEQFRLAVSGDFRENGRERIIYGLAVCHYHLGGPQIPINPLLKEERVNLDDFMSITSHSEQKTVVRKIPDRQLDHSHTTGKEYKAQLIRNSQEGQSRVYESIELCRLIEANEDGVLAILHLVRRSPHENIVLVSTHTHPNDEYRHPKRISMGGIMWE
jgi:hypothetical protein